MNILLFGHSYVRDLSRFGNWDREVELATGEKVWAEFQFMAYPDVDYAYFLDHPEEMSQIQELDPDVIIVILGGNSVTSDLSNSQIKEKAFAFYTLLKTAVRPECIKLAMQIEPRFESPGNSRGAPLASEFNRRRQILNNFTNKKLKKHGLVDRVIQLGSFDFLNNPQNYRDGVHLCWAGLEKYKGAVMGGLRYALENRSKVHLTPTSHKQYSPE